MTASAASNESAIASHGGFTEASITDRVACVSVFCKCYPYVVVLTIFVLAVAVRPIRNDCFCLTPSNAAGNELCEFPAAVGHTVADSIIRGCPFEFISMSGCVTVGERII